MTTPEPAASVIVPTYQGGHRLPVLFDALVAQDASDPWEVVVVVDGSTDDTRDVLEAYRDRLPLRVIDSPPPHGVVAALNAGFAAARGRVLIRCDDDLTPSPGMVRLHLDHHLGHDDIGVSCLTRDTPSSAPYVTAYGAAAAARRRRQFSERPAALRWIDWSAHNSVTRAAWDRLDHGFDPRFVYGQDSELAFRLVRSGLTVVLDPALEIEHRGACLSAANRVPRAYVAGASRSLFQRVHGATHDVADAVPTTTAQHVWAAGTRLTARVLRSWTAYERLGRGVEAALPRLTPRLGGLLVAFSVEAAGRAGRRHGPADLSTFRAQKGRETARERSRPQDDPGQR